MKHKINEIKMTTKDIQSTNEIIFPQDTTSGIDRWLTKKAHPLK